MKTTSAYAQKLLRKLKEDRDYWLTVEREGQTYVASLDEEPVIPDYDYNTVNNKLAEIDGKIQTIKHALNTVNVTKSVMIKDSVITIDALLVRMAQLNERKRQLDTMRKRQEKSRKDSGYYGNKKAVPEYEYVNYDLSQVQKDFKSIDEEISEMQLELDKFNQTYEFEVDVEI